YGRSSCRSLRIVTAFFFLIGRPPPRSPLFPYTTLFRSHAARGAADLAREAGHVVEHLPEPVRDAPRDGTQPVDRGHDGVDRGLRSEEHTSELQSRENLVCRLLLEKKKKRISTAADTGRN